MHLMCPKMADTCWVSMDFVGPYNTIIVNARKSRKNTWKIKLNQTNQISKKEAHSQRKNNKNNRH
jgi:hypothetical protein